MKLLVVLVLTCMSIGCADEPQNEPAPARAPASSTRSADGATPANAAPSASVAELIEIKSADQMYTVRFAPVPDPIPVNEFFEINAVIYDKQGRPLTKDEVNVEVDAAMPHHQHGMNHEPAVIWGEDGRVTVQNMLFHMTGYWEIYFDVTSDDITERAQTSVTIN